MTFGNGTKLKKSIKEGKRHGGYVQILKQFTTNKLQKRKIIQKGRRVYAN